MAETKRHFVARTTLLLVLERALPEAAVGSMQFVYYDASDPSKRLAPDLFVKVGSQARDFDTWKIWVGCAPDLAVEIVSDSNRSESEWAVKLARYQAAGIPEVVRFDPEEAAPLRVWDRVDGELIERWQGSPTLRECGALGLWWVVAPGQIGPVLRLARDSEGQTLLPTPAEERARLQEELAVERRARADAEHGRDVAIAEEKRLLAEEKRLLPKRDAAVVEEERLRAEEKRLLAERDAAIVECARLRAEIVRLRSGR